MTNISGGSPRKPFKATSPRRFAGEAVAIKDYPHDIFKTDGSDPSFARDVFRGKNWKKFFYVNERGKHVFLCDFFKERCKKDYKIASEEDLDKFIKEGNNENIINQISIDWVFGLCKDKEKAEAAILSFKQEIFSSFTQTVAGKSLASIPQEQGLDFLITLNNVVEVELSLNIKGDLFFSSTTDFVFKNIEKIEAHSSHSELPSIGRIKSTVMLKKNEESNRYQYYAVAFTPSNLLLKNLSGHPDLVVETLLEFDQIPNTFSGLKEKEEKKNLDFYLSFITHYRAECKKNPKFFKDVEKIHLKNISIKEKLTLIDKHIQKNPNGRAALAKQMTLYPNTIEKNKNRPAIDYTKKAITFQELKDSLFNPYDFGKRKFILNSKQALQLIRDQNGVVDFSHSTILDGKFSGAYFTRIQNDKTPTAAVNFSNSILQNADFTNADLRCVDFSGADLTGANFSNAIINEQTNFSNVKLTLEQCTQILGVKNAEAFNQLKNASEREVKPSPGFFKKPSAPIQTRDDVIRKATILSKANLSNAEKNFIAQFQQGETVRPTTSI